MNKEPIIVKEKIRFYALRDPITQRCPLMDFLEDLKKKDSVEYKKIMSLIDHTAKQGEYPKSDQKFKKESGKIYVFKSHQVRLYGFQSKSNEFIITNAYIKKRDKAKKEHLDKAEKMRKQYLEAINEQP